MFLKDFITEEIIQAQVLSINKIMYLKMRPLSTNTSSAVADYW